MTAFWYYHQGSVGFAGVGDADGIGVSLGDAVGVDV